MSRRTTTTLEELSVQSAALRVSRPRLVTTRDAQRRGLERDIREAPQRQLLDIGAQLDEAADLVERDADGAEATLDRLGEQATATLEELRDLARGIFPPLLVDKGVVAALEAHVRKVGANARVEAAPRSILSFTVRNEGRGFEGASHPDGMGMRIMQDRIDALEGVLTVESAPGPGTLVVGRIPARAVEEAPA